MGFEAHHAIAKPPTPLIESRCIDWLLGNDSIASLQQRYSLPINLYIVSLLELLMCLSHGTHAAIKFFDADVDVAAE